MNRRIMTVLAAAVLAGCASGQGSGDYSREQTRQVQDVQMGVVESVRTVTIEGTKSPVGTVAGGAIGGVAGSTVGKGKGSALGAVLGAVAGGLAGAAAEEAITRQPGLEIVLRLDSGRTIAVTQGADETFQPGDRVRVLTSGGVARVSR